MFESSSGELSHQVVVLQGQSGAGLLGHSLMSTAVSKLLAWESLTSMKSD